MIRFSVKITLINDNDNETLNYIIPAEEAKDAAKIGITRQKQAAPRPVKTGDVIAVSNDRATFNGYYIIENARREELREVSLPEYSFWCREASHSSFRTNNVDKALVELLTKNT